MCQACPRDRTMASFFKYVYAYWNARFMDPAVQDLYVLLTDVPVTKEGSSAESVDCVRQR
jgi:hypothetical protein